MAIKTKSTEGSLWVKEGKSLDVPHLDREITFSYPPKGPSSYVKVAKELDKSDLRRPIISENTSLLYKAWQNPEEKHSEEIINILRKFWLWCFNGILYVPKEGAYIQNKPEIRKSFLGGSYVHMDKSELVKKLEANDPSVRFVPFGYQIHELDDIRHHSLIIALNGGGEEGSEQTEKLAEVSGRNYKCKSYLHSFNDIEEPTVRVVALISDPLGNRLDIDCVHGYSCIGGGGGCAFGRLF